MTDKSKREFIGMVSEEMDIIRLLARLSKKTIRKTVYDAIMDSLSAVERDQLRLLHQSQEVGR